MKNFITFLASVLGLLIPFSLVAQGSLTQDLSISKLSLVYSCQMHAVPFDITLTNKGNQNFTATDFANLKIYYAIDTILGENINNGQILPAKDTLKADITPLANGLLKGQSISFALCEQQTNPILDMGEFGEFHQLRVWLECSSDTIVANNSQTLKIANPGKNLSIKGQYDPFYIYIPGLTPKGLWTEYPSICTPAEGGWNVLDSVNYIFLNEPRSEKAIGWRPGATDATHPNMDQWLFSDCFLLNSIDKYSVGFKALTYGDTHHIELALVKGLDPKGVVKIIDTLLVYSDEEITKFPFSQDFPVLTSFTAPEQGIYHLGMRILTPVKNAKARTRLSIDAFKVSNPTPYRIAINAAVYPQSSCDRGVEQVRLGFYNEGTERYADSMQIKLFYTLNGKDTVCLQKKTFLRLDAKMEISKSVFVNFDNIDMSAKGLYKFWATAQYKDDKGNIKNSSVFGSAVIGNTILNASPSSTPFAMSFEDQEYYQDWIGISAAAVGTWRRINTAGIRSAEQRDSTPMVMEAFAPSTGSTNAYLKSTCFQLSADSIYTLSSWIKWVGDTTVGPDGSTIRYSIAKTPTAVAFNKQNAVIYVNTQLHGLKEWTQFSKDFTVDSNQVYYIGFLFKAKTNTAAIHFDDVRLCARAKIAPIQNLKSSEITQNTAKISWDSISYPSTFYYKLSLNNVLVKDSLTTNTYNLTGLVANTQYTIQLEAWVAGQTNTSESSHTFTTLKSEIPIPANLAITQITAHTAIFSWDAVELDSAYSYTVYLDSTIVSQNSKATQYKFEKLKANTNYTASLALVVSHATENPLLQSRKFTTLKDTLAIEKGIENTFVKIYPNPSTNGLFTLQIQKAYQAYILDYQGRELWRISLNSGGHILDLSKYPKGIYFLYLQNKQENKVCKIINQ